MSKGKPKTIANWKWTGLFFLAGAADIAQIIIDCTGIGIIGSEVAEPYIGGVLIVLLQWAGANLLTKPKRIISLLGSGVADALTGGAAPFWTFDIWYIRSDVKAEEKSTQSAQQEEEFLGSGTRIPLNSEDGIREAAVTRADKPQYPNTSNGYGRPRGNIKSAPVEPLENEEISLAE